MVKKKIKKKCILFMAYITTLKYIHDFPKDAWTIQDIHTSLLNITIDH